MRPEILSACNQAVAAVANGVYQGVILTALVGLGLRVFGRTNAATRHGVWFSIMFLVAAIIPAHYLLDSRRPAAFLPRRDASMVSARPGAPATVAPSGPLGASERRPVAGSNSQPGARAVGETVAEQFPEPEPGMPPVPWATPSKPQDLPVASVRPGLPRPAPGRPIRLPPPSLPPRDPKPRPLFCRTGWPTRRPGIWFPDGRFHRSQA